MGIPQKYGGTMHNIIEFWYAAGPKKWYAKNEAFDAEIRERFSVLLKQAMNGELSTWENDPESCLGLIILLDQFSRNMFRGTAEMYASDELAVAVCKRAVEKGFDLKVEKGRNWFYMPLMHSENIEDQEQAIALFTQLAKDKGDDIEKAIRFAVVHRDTVKAWGRFPHRNKILDRKSTPEEATFLEGPHSSF